MKAIRHFITITHHKILVMQGCFRIGLYKQGLLHDMSKYSPTEFLVGCRYYKGYMSPNNAERADRGYSSAWLHHKGRNKHHLEYWIDYAVSKPGDDKAHTKMEGMKMPIRYVCEMFIDRVSASKNYQKEKYTDKSALEYYEKSVDHYMIHPDTKADEIVAMLEKVHGVKSLEDIGFTPDMKEKTARVAPYIRDRITFMRILKFYDFYDDVIK